MLIIEIILVVFMRSPKSPPNSPNPELAPGDDLKDIYINYWNKVSEQ